VCNAMHGCRRGPGRAFINRRFTAVPRHDTTLPSSLSRMLRNGIKSSNTSRGKPSIRGQNTVRRNIPAYAHAHIFTTIQGSVSSFVSSGCFTSRYGDGILHTWKAMCALVFGQKLQTTCPRTGHPERRERLGAPGGFCGNEMVFRVGHTIL